MRGGCWLGVSFVRAKLRPVIQRSRTGLSRLHPQNASHTRIYLLRQSSRTIFPCYLIAAWRGKGGPYVARPAARLVVARASDL